MNAVRYIKPTLALALVTGLLIVTAVAFVTAFRREAERADLQGKGRTIAYLIYYPGESMTTFESNWMPAMILFQTVPSARFESSTEYFRRAMSAEYLGMHFDDLDFRWFGGGGVPKNETRDPSAFSPTQNAWNVVADQSDRPSEDPFLITRNLPLPSLDATNVALSDAAPFGRRGIVVVTCGGVATFVPSNRIAKYLSELRATNLVLRP